MTIYCYQFGKTIIEIFIFLGYCYIIYLTRLQQSPKTLFHQIISLKKVFHHVIKQIPSSHHKRNYFTILEKPLSRFLHWVEGIIFLPEIYELLPCAKFEVKRPITSRDIVRTNPTDPRTFGMW